MAKQSYPLMALDIGLRRTGIAVASNLSHGAQPAGVLSYPLSRPEWKKLDKYIDEWQPTTIVLGKAPQTVGPLAKMFNRFRYHIESIHKITIVAISEELTTEEANHMLSSRDYSHKRKVEMRDQVAACLILESYLSNQ